MNDRMERQILIDELKQMKLVAHRLGFKMTDYPENSLEVLETILKNKDLLDACAGFEFDICFTKDHIPVVIHDKYIDDITDKEGLVRSYTFDELRKLNFKFRKTQGNYGNTLEYKVITLEALLDFFQDSIDLLDDKLIKIETKDYYLSNKDNLTKKNLEVIAYLLQKYPDLTKNFVHLSFWPLNLAVLKRIQKKKHYPVVRSDLLCDYSIMVFLTHFMPFLDTISLRVKPAENFTLNKDYSKRMNKSIRFDQLCKRFSNATKEKNIRYGLAKYGTVGIYTVNELEELDELSKNLPSALFHEHKDDIYITTDNPVFLKKIK